MRPCPPFVLAREHENHVAFGDMLTAYIIFCAVNVNVFGRIANLGLIANACFSSPIQMTGAMAMQRRHAVDPGGDCDRTDL